jgi:hypothetical protein
VSIYASFVSFSLKNVLSNSFIRNYSAYTSNPAYQAVAATILNEMKNPNNTMIGDHKYFMETKFSESKAAGKPWQVFVAGKVEFSMRFTNVRDVN